MTRWNGFARSLGFAVCAAAGVALWLVITAPLVGGRRALAIYLIGSVALYLAGLATTLRRGLLVGALVAIAGCAIAVVGPGLHGLLFGLAVLLAVTRSGWLYRNAPARALVLESGLLVATMLLADGVGSLSLRGIVLGVWGFFLVQSLFFLVSGWTPQLEDTPGRDPFEVAYARATAVLDREPI